MTHLWRCISFLFGIWLHELEPTLLYAIAHARRRFAFRSGIILSTLLAMSFPEDAADKYPNIRLAQLVDDKVSTSF